MATATSPTSLTASWDPPSDDDGFVTGYSVTLSSPFFGTSSQIISGTSTTYTNLIMNTTYTVRVAAINSIGTGAFRVISVTTPVVCPELLTTTSMSESSCDVCRFSEGSGPCYCKYRYSSVASVRALALVIVSTGSSVASVRALTLVTVSTTRKMLEH